MVVIRLSRAGTNKRPFYHMVVADRRKPRDGRYIEQVGYFNPVARGQEIPLLIETDRVQYWLSVGAQPSGRVQTLLKKYAGQKTVAAAPAEKAKPAAKAKKAAPKKAKTETKESAETPNE
ncbi:MAG: 30S ribosomal protein S16 [Proteobacteria bacterium]|nr:30S ribosomal protein S16 [Pseudomonadota bacterium]